MKAIATISAPTDGEHVTRLFTDDPDMFRSNGDGAADVRIGGRPFKLCPSCIRRNDHYRLCTALSDDAKSSSNE